MYGAILGDIFGSIYEFHNRKTDKSEEIELLTEWCHYTDDTAMTVAVADAILTDGDYQGAMRRWGRKFPFAGYGGGFRRWLASEDPKPYNSWGNGSAMRVSPVGWAFDSLDKTLEEAKRSAECTHNHPEGVKGAQATAASIFMARNGASRDDIRDYVTKQFGYDLSKTCAEIRPAYHFDESCQGTVPQALACFLESQDYKHCMQLAISIGGDSDTLACIAGGIAEAWYTKQMGPAAIPADMREFANNRIPYSMKRVVTEFEKKYAG